MRTRADKNTDRDAGGFHPPWQRALRRELGWLLAVKFVALLLLWWLFFSPTHRPHVDGDVASRKFALVQALPAPAPLQHTPEQ